MKISREGIVLIKSFEGFRPRAIRREDGGWVIGYGHTLSAREGASVSEADAELLLRYDLLPVEQSVNRAGSAVLNQHQFDALVSFAFSVGVDRFTTSDVLHFLTAGATDQAGDAVMGWPEPALPQVALRRRAAERALFVADPAAPVAVSDLLVAPPELSEPTVSPTQPGSLQSTEALPLTAEVASIDPRAAAVSALLGEATDPQPTGFALPPAVSSTPDTPRPANDILAPLPAQADAVAAAVTDTDADQPETVSGGEPYTPPIATDSNGQVQVPAADPVLEAASQVGERSGAPIIAASLTPVHRYTPYGATMVGPLPFLQPARDASTAPKESAAIPETPYPEAEIVRPFAQPADVEPLVLNPVDDAPVPAMTRQPWTQDERNESIETSEGGLFGDDVSLTQGGAPVMRHGDVEFDAPASFDWSETGAFVIMGAVGLTAFGAAMAAFRLASEQAGGEQTTIIAWVLAVIGAACVGVSSFNLYRRWGLPGGDN